jgi:Nuclease-related domain
VENLNHLAQLMPPLLIIFLCGLFYLAARVLVARNKLKKRKSPFPENFLRTPGERLRSRMQNINDDINVYLCSAFLSPMIIYSGLITLSYFGNKTPSLPFILMIILPAAALEAHFIFKLVKLISRRRKLRLGYEGQLAVGQELNQLLRYGYYVYHDFPAEKFNIDHVIVGPAGVYAVATKAWQKPNTGNGQSDAKVIYDGQKLHFPDWAETKPLKQARKRAQWLSKWLSSAVGDYIHVQPVVALPGWFVDRMSANGLPVINPREVRSILNSNQGSALDEKMLSRIVHQIDQRCRDVHSRAGEGLGGKAGLAEKENNC